MTKKLLSRRTFLKGLAASAANFPLLRAGLFGALLNNTARGISDVNWGTGKTVNDLRFAQTDTSYLLRDEFVLDTTTVVDGPVSGDLPTGYRNLVAGSSFATAAGRLRGGSIESTLYYTTGPDGGGWSRAGGRTLAVSMTPDDAASNVGIYLAETPGSLDGYGLRMNVKKFEVIEPGGTPIIVTLPDDNTGKALRYLVGITLTEDFGAVYWISALQEYQPDRAWLIPNFPSARILFVSTLGNSGSLYPTLHARSAYGGNASFEDVRLLDVPAWAGRGGLALASDNFDRTDNPQTLGEQWITQGGTWGIIDNQAYCVASDGITFTYMDVEQADVWVVANVTAGAEIASEFGLLLRRLSPDTYLTLSNHGSGNIFLDRVVEGQYRQSIFSTHARFVPNETKRWLVGCYGNEYRLFINGNETLIQPTPDPQQQHARGRGFGLVSHRNQTGQRWDAFAVYPLIFALERELDEGIVPIRAIVGSTQNYDTFTDSDGTDLTVHLPETGGLWAIDSGTWQIVNGTAVSSGAGGHHRAFVQASADVQVSVQLIIPLEFPIVRAGLIVRRSDPNNYVYIRCFVDDATQLNNDEIEVWEVINGRDRILSKSYLGNHFHAGGVHLLVAQVVGDTLNIYLDGVPQMTLYLSPELLDGRGVGLYRQADTANIVFDNFAAAPAAVRG